MACLDVAHGGDNKWTELVEKAKHTWNLIKYKVVGKYTLSIYYNKYHNIIKTVKDSSEHPRVRYVIANEKTRIPKLLDSIMTND